MISLFMSPLSRADRAAKIAAAKERIEAAELKRREAKHARQAKARKRGKS